MAAVLEWGARSKNGECGVRAFQSWPLVQCPCKNKHNRRRQESEKYSCGSVNSPATRAFKRVEEKTVPRLSSPRPSPALFFCKGILSFVFAVFVFGWACQPANAQISPGPL